MSVDHAPRARRGRPEQQLLKRRFTARTLPQLRVGVAACAASAGLTEPRRGEFVLAVGEVVTNAVEHAGGKGELVLCRVGQELEARVSDAGPGFTADVIPELLPGLDGCTDGRGLWLARLTTDRLTITAADPGAADPGTVVTLAVTLPAPGPLAGGGEPEPPAPRC